MKALHAVAAGLLPAALRRLRPLLPARRRSPAHAALGDSPRRSRSCGSGPPGLDRAWSSAPHEGVARDLVAALKFRRLLPVAGLMAERIQWLAPASLLSGAIVPVPTATLRSAAARLRPRRRDRRRAGRANGCTAAGLPRAHWRRAPGGPAPRRAARPPAAGPRSGRGAAQRPAGRRRADHRRHAFGLRPGPA